MVLDDFQFRMLSGSEDMDLSRNAIALKRYRWTNGKVPYKFDEEVDVVPENVRNQIKNVIAEMNSQISDNFRPVLSLSREADVSIILWTKIIKYAICTTVRCSLLGFTELLN